MKIKDIIIDKRSDAPFTFKDIKDIVKDDDVLDIGWQEGYYSDNNSYDGHYLCRVTREREQTEEEKQEFKKELQKLKEKSKAERYKSYLKLKEEFDEKV